MGVLVALFDLIPLVGASIGGALVVAVAFTAGLAPGLLMAAVQIGYQQVENNVLQPVVMRRSVNVSGLTVLLAVLVGSTAARHPRRAARRPRRGQRPDRPARGARGAPAARRVAAGGGGRRTGSRLAAATAGAALERRLRGLAHGLRRSRAGRLRAKEQIMPSTRRTIATALTALAATAPVAAARPVDPGYIPPKSQPVAVSPSAPGVRTVVVHRSGFDWLDAAIGAAVAAGLLSLTGAAVIVARRSPDDGNAAIGAH